MRLSERFRLGRGAHVARNGERCSIDVSWDPCKAFRSICVKADILELGGST